MYTDRIDTIVIIDQAGTLIRLYGGRLKNGRICLAADLCQKLHWPAETARKQSKLEQSSLRCAWHCEHVLAAVWTEQQQGNEKERDSPTANIENLESGR